MTPGLLSGQTFIERILIVIAAVIFAVLLLIFVYYVFDVILLVFASALIAIFLHGLADFLRRFERISEGWAVLVVTVLLTAILVGSIALLAPSVAEQVRLLREEVPASAQKASAYISQFSWGQTIIDQLPSTDDVMQRIDTASLLTSVGGFFSSTVGALGNFFITILLAIYFASEPRFYAAGFTKLFPIGRRERVTQILSSIYETLRWWLIGKVGSMIFIGLLTWVGLWLLDIPLALTLGLIAGLLSFIPNFGPIISAIPAILFAFIESPVKSLYVLGLYVGVQLIESNLVTPLIERETVELPPALTILSQLALAVLVGGLGLVLATPLLVVVMVIVQMVYIQDILGDRRTDVNEKVDKRTRNETAQKIGDEAA